MQLSESLEDWTLDTVLVVVKAHEFEPSRFDFKEVLHATASGRDAFNASLGRTACSMASSGGGFILFGVRDRGVQVETPEDRVVGLRLTGDLRKEFGEKIQRIQPEVSFDAKVIRLVVPDGTERGILVVHIPLSQRRPHMFEGIFYRRGDGGHAVPMGFYEVREQMLFNEERLRKATLFRLEIAQCRMLVGAMLQQPDMVTSVMARFDTSAFKILLADVCSLLPPDNDLLEDLLHIPFLARLVNEFLNRATYPGLQVLREGQEDPKIERRKAILENARTLGIFCARCEERLGTIFGPLTTTGGSVGLDL